MYASIAKRIVGYLIDSNVINEKERDIYEYSYEVMISQSIYITLMLLLALLFGKFFESVIFFAGFYVYRKIAGGYHASTYLKCHILSVLNQLVFLFILNHVSEQYFPLIDVIIVAIVTVITFIVAPMDHPNKQFDSREYKKYKKLSRIYVVVLMLLTCFFMIMNRRDLYFFCYLVGVVSASLSLLYSYVERRENKYGEA